MRVLAGLNQGPPAGMPPPPSANAGFSRVDRLKGNIGYIKLLGFPGPGPFNLVTNQAMADLASTDALIIDIRDNGGGRPESVSYFCSFFFDPKTPVHLNDIIHRKPGTNEFTTTEFWTKAVGTSYQKKPVYLLTSKRTFSGGEEFVNDLKVQKRAKVFGETTGGGANPGGVLPIDRRLGIGIFIPDGRAENPITNDSWEGRGVTPDVTVDEKQALQAVVLDILKKRHGEVAASLKREITTQSDVDPIVEAHFLKIRTTALPGSAEAVRRNLEDLARGTPNYDQMSPELANATRVQLPMLQASISKLGAIEAVAFSGVAPDGYDIYDVTLANGVMQCGIFVTPDGKIESAWIRPAAAIPAAH
jgi:retinol-binding protein 3